MDHKFSILSQVGICFCALNSRAFATNISVFMILSYNDKFPQLRKRPQFCSYLSYYISKGLKMFGGLMMANIASYEIARHAEEF